MTPFKALVLAGSRGGQDPVAAYAGVSHKALIQLGGETLLARVVNSLKVAGAQRLAIISSHPDVRVEALRLSAECLDEAIGPSLSALAGADALGTPLLITTADHALLEPVWVERFLADCPADADVVALVAARATVEAAVPQTQRTWLKLADGHWSGCNLFYLAKPQGLTALNLWRRVEAERKRPWRMAQILGPGVLLRYAAGRLSLAAAASELGRRAGVTAAVVQTPYGRAAIDVDKPADLDLVRRLIGS